MTELRQQNAAPVEPLVRMILLGETMSKKQWGHGYHAGVKDGEKNALQMYEENARYFEERGAESATRILAMQMYHLLEGISEAAEFGEIERRWALLSAARELLLKHYQPPSHSNNVPRQDREIRVEHKRQPSVLDRFIRPYSS